MQRTIGVISVPCLFLVSSSGCILLLLLLLSLSLYIYFFGFGLVWAACIFCFLEHIVIILELVYIGILVLAEDLLTLHVIIFPMTWHLYQENLQNVYGISQNVSM